MFISTGFFRCLFPMSQRLLLAPSLGTSPVSFNLMQRAGRWPQQFTLLPNPGWTKLSLEMNRRFVDLSENELARLTQAGDLQAFDELVGRFEHRLYAFLSSRVGNDADVRELT